MRWYEEQRKKRDEFLQKHDASLQEEKVKEDEASWEEDFVDVFDDGTLDELRETLEEIQDMTGGELVETGSRKITSSGWSVFFLAFLIQISLSFSVGWLLFGWLSSAFPPDTPFVFTPLGQWLSSFR